MRTHVEDVLRALEAEQVRYLVVGGVAVVLHGFLRTTADLDLVIALDDLNSARAVRALEKLGFVPRAPVPLALFADARVRRGWIEEKNMQVFSLWHADRPGFEVDLFVEEPFEFAAAHARALRVQLATTAATIVGLDDLLHLKRQAARPLDLADVSALEEIRAREREQPPSRRTPP